MNSDSGRAPAALLRQPFSFPGGLKLAAPPLDATSRSVLPAGLPARLIVPLHQHIGAPARLRVKVGDRVLKGQLLAAPSGYVSAAVHAPTSGRIADIDDYPVPHPSGLMAPCVVIDCDGEDRWIEDTGLNADDPMSLDPATLRQRVRDAGIVGLGGAAFPTAVKLNARPERALAMLLLNGAECEPYICCDDMLMRERPERILSGAAIMCRALHVGRCIIGVEDNKPEAAETLRQAITVFGNDEIELRGPHHLSNRWRKTTYTGAHRL